MAMKMGPKSPSVFLTRQPNLFLTTVVFLQLLLFARALSTSNWDLVKRYKRGAILKAHAAEDDFGFDDAPLMIDDDDGLEEEVDIAIVGAGIGGLVAGAILNTLYGKKVGVYESHYLAGGCAHAFERQAANGVTFTFDSGPTILLG
jgi:hypothetical protein